MASVAIAGLRCICRVRAPTVQRMHSHRLRSSLSKAAATSPPDYPLEKRWTAVPPANAVHLSIGAVYVYSMWTPGLTTCLGVVGSAPLDWGVAEVLPVFSTAAVTLGVTTSVLGSWVEKAGPRLAGSVGSLFWGSALMTTALGVEYHSLPLVYLGYGVLGGVGWGMMYLAPVTTVMKWFPDRRGLATGIALSAFGAGAAVAPSLIHVAMDYFAVAPDFIGSLADGSSSSYVELMTLPDGSQVVANNSVLGEPGQPALVATEADLARNPHVSTGPGAYALGTGDTGTSKALASLGALYGALGLIGSRFMKIPHHDWQPTLGLANTTDISAKKDDEPEPAANHDVGLPASYVTTNTTQFPLLWLSVFGNATGGLALLSSSKLMLTDIFAGAMPAIVTESFATGYVSSLGIGMAVGRFGWSALSDKLGRQNTYALFGLGMPIVAMAPTLCHEAVYSTSTSPSASILLGTFYAGSTLAITFYGGVFSVLPAYIADLFGQRYSGAIHGKALTAWAASAVCGPMGLAYLRSQSYKSATHDLLSAIEDEAAFESAFGCTLGDHDKIAALIDAKTLSISRLMEFVPDGTVDPTPFLYDSTCYAAAGLMGVSFLANLAIRPMDVKKTLAALEEEESRNRK
mmetsp:Transcript_26729/g.54231  ORF Transcript_26729/g.54231 Transcript_26729/m.54231 type:complete len:631 (-) Transcript_26729:303-2195(-)|eukprot:CAMPEP_0178694492 /NCGR_PEP_ID=MMETSP0699-20121125/8277_1 /TAXON_ID=265572 /ORGANISM="Extubocellulus spinifer, Strain CCMP396" /LENGTH=630 /DNA_ID=CAMNT_0020339979 /DNA_START=64 /DNA_END=1956 /DNA_ORIENTATION=-